jgi:hypothetical protein
MSNFRIMLTAFIAIGIASTALAQKQTTEEESQGMGTPEQRAACGPDVGRFCKSVKPEDGPFAYLACLQENSEKLRPACLKVISGR